MKKEHQARKILKSSKRFFQLIILLMLLFVGLEYKAQTPPPGHHWKKVTFRDKDLLNNSGITQTTSGDEWWFSHKNLYDANGDQIGYIAVGYLADLVNPGDEAAMMQVFNEGADSPCNVYPVQSTIFYDPNQLNSNCEDLYDHMSMSSTVPAAEARTAFRGMVARLDMHGNMIWCRLPNIDGSGLQDLTIVGDYIYVVGSHAGAKDLNFSNNNANRAFIPYNRTSSASNNYFDKSVHTSIPDGGKIHMYVAKYNFSGTKIWEGIYGAVDFASPVNAWASESTGMSLLHNTNDGFIYAVGRARDTPTGNFKCFVTRIDPANGNLDDANVYSLPSIQNSFSENLVYMEARSVCQTNSSGDMVLGGMMSYANEALHGYIDFQRGFIMGIKADFGLNTGWSTNPVGFSTTIGITETTNIWSICYHTALDEVLVGLLTDCDRCSFSGNNYGRGEVWRFDPATGVASTSGLANPSDMGPINAFDLRIGVTETSDGGFAAVSSRRNANYTIALSDLGTFSTCVNFSGSQENSPNNLSGTNPYGPWDSDPLIVKFAADGSKVWEWSEDVVPGRPRQLPPGDLKRQECMYKITEAQDLGLVISGNCSFNHDDNYMVKLHSECNLNQQWDIFGSGYTNGNKHTLTTNTTWNSSQKIFADVVIPNGVQLTITGSSTKIRFADNEMTGFPSGITIEPGGKLYISGGAEVTSIDKTDCPLSMWAGITVLGNSNQNQALANQGYLSIVQSTISNARCAILTGSYQPSGEYDVTTSGGIIYADRSSFINNLRSAQYMTYSAPMGHKNIGIFYDCKFQTNAQLNSGAYPMGHVSMYRVDGVRFLGCKFEYNAGSAYPPMFHGYGILSMSASYAIEDKCPTCTSDRTVFKNLRMGIEVYNSNTFKSINVDHAIFESDFTGVGDVTGGISMSGTRYTKITRCDFDLADFDSEGVFLYKSKYYDISNNNFEGNGGGYGIVVSHSQDGEHKIYRNNFSNNYIGIKTQFENSTFLGTPPQGQSDLGLKMNCNTFMGSNTFNIAMTGYAQPAFYASVAQNQGVLGTSANTRVRNRYLASCGNNEQWHISSGLSTKNINHAAFDETNTKPIAPCGDQLLIINGTGSFDYPTHCPNNAILPVSNLACACGHCCLKDDIDLGLSTAIGIKNAVEVNYHNTVDGGETQYLLDAIATATPGGSDLLNLLLSHSPYLSDAVLEAYINDNSNPVAHIISVHDSNKPVSLNVWNVIIDRSFSEPDMITLNEQQQEEGESAMMQLENELTLARGDLQYVYGQKINYYMHDSVEGAIDTLIILLSENIGELADAPIQLVDAYVMNGNYDRAFEICDSLKVLPEYEDIITLNEMILKLDTSAKKRLTLLDNPAWMAVIEEYANDSTKEGCYEARAVLYEVTGRNMNFLRVDMGSMSERMATNSIINPNSNKTKNEKKMANNVETVAGLKIYPNPAKNNFNIHYASEYSKNSAYSIRDVVGREVAKGSLQTNVSHEINADLLHNGIYFITLIENNSIVAKQKIVIMK